MERIISFIVNNNRTENESLCFYPDEIIEDVRLHNDVVEVIGLYVHLQKKGSSHFGLCPFHNEKNAFIFCE